MFRVEHNRDIRITSSSGSKRRSTRVPDFAFATDDTPPKYLFLLECAWSQPFQKVNSKALQLLTRKDVRVVVVICIDVQAGTMGSPGVPSPETYQISDEKAFPDPRNPLSNVVFQGTVWARGIKKIMVHLYQHEYDTRSYVRFFSPLFQFLMLSKGYHPRCRRAGCYPRKDCVVFGQLFGDHVG